VRNVEVTVAVPVRDRRERMLRCLDALLAQDHPSYEVIVLDNGSTDGTAEACAERARAASVPVRVERVEGTLGAVRNRGAAMARGRYVAFTDSDCLPEPAWLRRAAAALDADDGLGFVCGRTLPEEIPSRAWSWTVNVTRFSWRFESCNVVFRTRALRESDGFDEVVGDGWEDTAAGFELLSHGWRTAFVEDAVVRHDVTYPGFWFHVRREQRQRNAGRVVRRYPEIRRRLLFARVFLNSRGAASFAAYLGLAAGVRRPRARLLALPYLAFVLARVLPWRMAQIVILDLALHAAFLRGALRHRTLLL
jgi:glycosyltransferase involved in cell wall biosynthesis